ncbi:MAG: Type I restriction-modification system, DNA-methyltransferase subunit M [Nitrospira sp.]|nr:MAG: Type I restriction-modification system, DNA-methyltransferase subunit M [Nitrospira sp.]
MPKSKREPEKPKNGESTGLEAKLWAAADALRNNMDAAEYKHVVLGPRSRRSARSWTMR